MFEDLTRGKQDSVENNRSIKSIIDDPQNNITNGHSDQKYSAPSGPQMSSGGNKESPNPLWVYDDQTIMPNYSQGKKVTDTFESYKNMLDSNTVPDHIKIQLLQFLKDKYDKTRAPYDNFELDVDEDPDYDTNVEILHSILDPMGVQKRRKAKDIATVFLNNGNLIKWDSRGNFILPKYVDNSTINLKSLLRTLVYSNEGSEQEIQSTVEIIKPFFKSVKHLIVNKKILRRLESILDNVTKKYVALNSTKKRKK